MFNNFVYFRQFFINPVQFFRNVTDTISIFCFGPILNFGHWRICTLENFEEYFWTQQKFLNNFRRFWCFHLQQFGDFGDFWTLLGKAHFFAILLILEISLLHKRTQVQHFQLPIMDLCTKIWTAKWLQTMQPRAHGIVNFSRANLEKPFAFIINNINISWLTLLLVQILTQ